MATCYEKGLLLTKPTENNHQLSESQLLSLTPPRGSQEGRRQKDQKVTLELVKKVQNLAKSQVLLWLSRYLVITKSLSHYNYFAKTKGNFLLIPSFNIRLLHFIANLSEENNLLLSHEN